MNTIERFLAKVDKTDSCWIWTAAKSKRGYGWFRDGALHQAHRYSFKLFKGDIPNGLLVCHACDVPSCVNPNHLWLGTAKDNTADRDIKGRRPKKYNKNKAVK